MLAENPLMELQWRIERHYAKYVFWRLLGASVFAATIALSGAYVVFELTNDFVYSGLVVLLVGWLLQSLLIRFFVPTTDYMDASKAFIRGAIDAPARIQKADGKRIEIEDDEGVPRLLRKMERRIWNSAILPYIIEEKARVEAQRKALQSQNQAAAPVASRRDELEAWEQKMQQERTLLKKEREKLEKRITELQRAEETGDDASSALERAGIGPSAGSAKEEREQLEKKFADLEKTTQELEERTKYVNYVEDSLVERLNELTRREAEVEQKEINSGISQEE